MQKFLENGYLGTHSPGYVIEILENGMASELAFGNKTVRPEVEPTSGEVLYDLASITKLFTAVLVHKAAEEGRLDLDTRIGEIDPDFANLEKTTLRDLLEHNQEINTDIYLGKATSAEDFREILHAARIKSPQPTYVCAHYMILAEILAKIYDTPFEKLMEKKIIAPLGLQNTTFHPEAKRSAPCNFEYRESKLYKNLPPGTVHDPKARQAEQFGIYTGNAGLFATGADLLKFLRALMNGEVLKTETLEQILAPRETEELAFNSLGSLPAREVFGSTKPLSGRDADSGSLGERAAGDRLLSERAITFSGFTGPMFVLDFEREKIVLVMSNVLHNTHLSRAERKHKSREIIQFILEN